MPINYDINRSENLTIFTLSGEVSFQDFTVSLTLYGKSGPTLFELYDVSALSGRRLSSDEMDMLAGYLSRFSDVRPKGSKTAIVASEDLNFGLSRMLSILMEGRTVYNIQAFRNIDKAKKWLTKSDG